MSFSIFPHLRTTIFVAVIRINRTKFIFLFKFSRHNNNVVESTDRKFSKQNSRSIDGQFCNGHGINIDVSKLYNGNSHAISIDVSKLCNGNGFAINGDSGKFCNGNGIAIISDSKFCNGKSIGL